MGDVSDLLGFAVLAVILFAVVGWRVRAAGGLGAWMALGGRGEHGDDDRQQEAGRRADDGDGWSPGDAGAYDGDGDDGGGDGGDGGGGDGGGGDGGDGGGGDGGGD